MALHILDAVPSDRSTLPVHYIEPMEGAPDAFRLMKFGLLDLNFLASFPHRHGFYSMLLVESGHGEHSIDFQTHPIVPPCFYFLSPGQVHYWKLDRPPMGKIISFKPEFLVQQAPAANILYELDCFHGVTATPCLPLSTEQLELLGHHMDMMEREYSFQDQGRERNLRSYLTILLTWIKRWCEISQQQPPPEEAPLVRRFMGMVSEHFVNNRNVSFYANELGLSAGHLTELIKNATGRSPGQIIREQVLLEAKRLLAHTDLSVAEVGYKLMFEDPAYFSRFFRREAGSSPGDFRKQALEKYQQF